MSTSFTRREVLKGMSGSLVAAAWPGAIAAQTASERRFDPVPGAWRTFEIETVVTLRKPPSTAATLWIPTPVVNTDWQRSMDSAWTGNHGGRGAMFRC
jgi:hypothetical protein